MNFKKTYRTDNLLILIILIISFLPRYFSLYCGLPYSFHPDEHYMIDFTNNFINNNWNPVKFNPRPFIYGPVLMFITAIIGKILLFFNSFLHINLPEQYNILFLGRFVVSITGSLCALFTFKMCRFFCSSLISSLAAILLSLSQLHLIHSSYFTPDVPLTLFSIITIYYCQKILSFSKLHLYLLTAIFSSLAFSTKFTSAILIFPILISHFLSPHKQKNPIKLILHPYLILLASTFIILTLIMLNYMFFPIKNFELFLNQLKTNALAARSRDIGCIYQNKLFYYSTSIFQAFYPYIALIIPFSTTVFFLKLKKLSIPILSFILPFFFIHCIVRNYSSRYILPIIPLIAILIAYSIYFLLYYFSSNKIAKSLLIGLLLIQLMLASFNTIKATYIMHLPDTHLLASDWINNYIPPEAFVSYEGKYPNVKRKNSKKILDFFLKKNQITKNKKIDFYVISSESNTSFQEMMNCSDRTKFYENLELNNILIKTFRFKTLVFSQPEIKIIKNKHSSLPPFFQMQIQPLTDSLSYNFSFLNKPYSSNQKGGIILKKGINTFFFLSSAKLDSLSIYLHNLSNQPENIKIKTGISSFTIHLHPYERKLTIIKPHLSFPYLKFFYKIKIINAKSKNKIYTKIITDPFNEAIAYCSLYDFHSALSKIQIAHQLEKNNPLISYFNALLLYLNKNNIDASQIIKHLPANMFQFYHSTYLSNEPINLGKYSKKLRSLPPGYYLLQLDIESPSNFHVVNISLGSYNFKLIKKYTLKAGKNLLILELNNPLISDLSINIRAPSSANLKLNKINLSLNKSKLIEDLLHNKFDFQCYKTNSTPY